MKIHKEPGLRDWIQRKRGHGSVSAGYPDFGVDKAGSFLPGLWVVHYSKPFSVTLSSASQKHPEVDTNVPSALSSA